MTDVMLHLLKEMPFINPVFIVIIMCTSCVISCVLVYTKPMGTVLLASFNVLIVE